MANRFPLILNTNSNQIQELSASDTLDLTGSGLNLTGITTLTTSAELNLGGGVNINSGTRGDILYYDSNGRIAKLNLGTEGQVLKSNGTDLVYGASASVANVYYVSTTGTDASGFGSSVDSAFKTIKYACSNIGTPTAANPAIIFVKAGTYEETLLPIVVPPNTTIAGDSLRATIIKPKAGLDSGGSVQNNRSTMFRMSDATVLQDLVMDGMGGYTPGSPAYKPESATIGGIYLALNAASPILTKSPYIYNVTSFGNGATGAVLDGSLHASGNRSMLFHTYTSVHSDGLGIFLKANANAEMISTFSYFCQVGFACIGGSKIRSLNSSNAYGEYGVYSAGFDAGESPNQGTVRGNMLTYVGVLGTSFTDGEQITGGTSGATAYVVNVQSEPKRMYVVQKSGTFQANETVTGGSSGATATMAAASVETNQSGRILVTQFGSSADAGDSLQFASTDGNAYQIQSVSSVTANSVAYHVLVFSTDRATPVASGVTVNVRKEFSLIRLTGHDFLQVGTGGTDTTNWPNNPTQNPNQDYQVTTNTTDPGRVYYTATDDLGNFYVGDQFKVDQATGNVTLDASAFNLSGLESLRLGSVGGLIGASINEFSTDGTMSQNSDSKVSTQKAVKTYVDSLNSITPGTGIFTLAGISTVTGTTLFTKQLNVSGVSTFHGNINLLDGDRARFGNSDDLQIYHDSNNSYISENGAGNLIVSASTGEIKTQINNIGIVTTSPNGINVNGICTAHQFIGDGSQLTGVTSVGGDTGADFNDNIKIRFGTSNDLEIFHDGSNSNIANSTGVLSLSSSNHVTLKGSRVNFENAAGSEVMLKAFQNGQVELYQDNTKKISTSSAGMTIYGSGADSLRLEGAMGSAGTEQVIITNSTSGGAIQIGLQQTDSDGNHHRSYIKSMKGTGSITGRIIIEARGAGGGTNRGFDIDAGTQCKLNLSFYPTDDNSYDLGGSSNRWRNIYTADLKLSNKGSQNDVDGTWGNYTIQEGESDLFLINNRSGKKYKFNLTEVS